MARLREGRPQGALYQDGEIEMANPTHMVAALVAVLFMMAMGFWARTTGLPMRGYYNPDFIAYHREAAYLDGKGDLPPGHAKPMHIELHRLAFRLFGTNKDAMSWLGAIIGTLNIGLVYLLAKRLFKDKWTPLLAAAFLAVSGYNIMYAGRGYNHADVTFFSLLAAILLCGKLTIPAALGIGVCAGLAISCHYNVLVCLPVLGLFVLLFSKRWYRLVNPLVYGLGILLPMAAFNLYYLSVDGVDSYLDQIRFMSGTAGGTMMDFRYLPHYVFYNAWLDGWVVTVLAGIAVVWFVAADRKGRFWYVVILAVWSLLFWGSYNYKVPRTQTFACWTFPLLTAYIAGRVIRLCGPRVPAPVWAALATAIFFEPVICLTGLRHLGKGHQEVAAWIMANDRRPCSNARWPTNSDYTQYHPMPNGPAKLWYLDVYALLGDDKVDCLVVDHAAMYHNLLYNRMTHPGSERFAVVFFQLLYANSAPIYETCYAEPRLCQIENGRIWHLPTSSGQRLSGRICVYDAEQVKRAYIETLKGFMK